MAVGGGGGAAGVGGGGGGLTSKTGVAKWMDSRWVANHLAEVSTNNHDEFEKSLPDFIKFIFGIPTDLEEIMQMDEKSKLPSPLLFPKTLDQPDMDLEALVVAIVEGAKMTGERRHGTPSSSRNQLGKTGGLFLAVRKLRQYTQFKFPCRYLPEKLIPRQNMQVAVECSASQLLLYAIAAFPVVSKQMDARVWKSGQSMQSRGYPDAYLRILHKYLEETMKADPIEVKQTLDVLSAFWLDTSCFVSGQVGRVPSSMPACLEKQTKDQRPNQRQLKAIEMLIERVTDKAICLDPRMVAHPS
eukprot:766373-Hanusia_phi.AAC.1